ncbi:MerR family DNA-binding transcriptional regulator [Alicyclobacillaceae bacterium I2511]|nr:MerR family DNA-binding transcriptional regulator [Alicyclobacillaceae bacterium I2511]
METEEFLPVGKVAKLLGVTPQTIRRWQKEGGIRNTLTYKSTLILGNVHKRFGKRQNSSSTRWKGV